MALNGRFLLVVGAIWVSVASAACTPGYMKASDLERKGQGPKDCQKSCEDLGMRMVAMVLVSNELPGCVCQPLVVAPAPGADAPVSQDGNAPSGAAAAVAGEVVLAAAASAARQEQLRQQQQQQQRYSSK